MISNQAVETSRRRVAAIPADRAAVVGLRQLRDPLQGLRPEGRPARPVREGRRRGPGPPVHRGRADAWRSTSRGTASTTTPTWRATRASCGVSLGHDQLERLPGRRLHARQRLQPGSARAPQGARPPPRLHRHHGRDRARGTSSCGSRTGRTTPARTTSGPARIGSPRHSPPSTPGSGRTSGCCSSTSSSSRRSTRWTCPDWGTAYIQCVAAGPKAKVVVDTGHHAPGTNIEFIVASLLRAGPPRRVRLQLALLRRRRPDGRLGRPVPAVPDHARGRPGGRASAPTRASRSCSTSATTSSPRSPVRSAR